MSPWRTSLLMTVSAMVLLAVGAILLNGAGAQPRADLAGYAGSAAAGEATGTDPASLQDAAAIGVESAPPGVAGTDATAGAPADDAGSPEAAGGSGDSLPAALPAVPTGLSIPSLGVLSAVVPVGLEADGSMQIPGAQEAGWYLPGRIPGSPTGSAVIAAHVDFNDSPGVFFDLRNIQPGSEVLVSDASGATHRFTVTERIQLAKEQVPMEQLFRTGGDPVLTLVTCGGAFDRSERSYADNIIVWATPVAA
ncbi:MAG: class F sortase [Microthrixaceae bacterium]|nr:class F sortase [Microthrixaceae bacterium]